MSFLNNLSYTSATQTLLTVSFEQDLKLSLKLGSILHCVAK